MLNLIARGVRRLGRPLVVAFALALVLALPASTPAQAAPGVSGDVPSNGGTALLTWAGGSVADLAAGLVTDGCDANSLWFNDGGAGLVGYVPATTIAAVNQDFRDRFPDEVLPGDTPVLVSCAGGSGSSDGGSVNGDAEPSDPDYIETFDGDPPVPTPWNPSGWDVTVHSRDRDTWRVLESMQAHHGADCSPPMNTHQISDYEHTVFNCKNHMMTSLTASGYGVIYLTPDQLVDFSGGNTTISWDMSLSRSSSRDWVDLWITPWEVALQAPLEEWLPDLNGYPRDAIHVRMDQHGSETVFLIYVIRDFQIESVGRLGWVSYESFARDVNDARVRQRFELTIGQDYIKFGMPDYDHWWADTSIDQLDWTTGVVQFGHHSYNPKKGGEGTPNTWHWDNIAIGSTEPFTMLPATRRYVDADTTSAVQFAGPAPANAHLRFMGIGTLEVSYDGGRTWESPREVPDQQKRQAEQFRSYFTPIPEGTRTVQFRGGPDGWWEHWQVRDMSIWAR